MSFKDKIVLITGAAVGIGRETALAFARREAYVIVNYSKSAEYSGAAEPRFRSRLSHHSGHRSATVPAQGPMQIRTRHSLVEIDQWLIPYTSRMDGSLAELWISIV